MGLLSWIVFGALAGWVASMIAGNSRRQGCLTDIIVGVVGAFIGGFVVSLISGDQIVAAWNLRSFCCGRAGLCDSAGADRRPDVGAAR